VVLTLEAVEVNTHDGQGLGVTPGACHGLEHQLAQGASIGESGQAVVAGLIGHLSKLGLEWFHILKDAGVVADSLVWVTRGAHGQPEIVVRPIGARECGFTIPAVALADGLIHAGHVAGTKRLQAQQFSGLPHDPLAVEPCEQQERVVDQRDAIKGIAHDHGCARLQEGGRGHGHPHLGWRRDGPDPR
jgi:hypothetical protein